LDFWYARGKEDEKVTRESLLKREAAEYMVKTEMTPPERQELLDWIKDGNSAYDNPWDLYDDSGYRMDYIEAMRVMPELIAQNAFVPHEPEPLSEYDPDDF
jgi:hypothetical protein